MKTIVKSTILGSALLTVFNLYSCNSLSENKLTRLENQPSFSAVMEGEDSAPSTEETEVPINTINPDSKEVKALKEVLELEIKKVKEHLESQADSYFDRPMLSIIHSLFNGNDVPYTGLEMKLKPYMEEDGFDKSNIYDGPFEKNTINEYIRLMAIADYLCKIYKPNAKVKPIIRNYIVCVGKRLHIKALAAKDNKSYTMDKKEMLFESFVDSVKENQDLYKLLSGEQDIDQALTLAINAIDSFKGKMAFMKRNLKNITLLDIVKYANDNQK